MIKKNYELATIAKLFTDATKIAFFCHVKPDADSLGSALALCETLKQRGKICKVFCESEIGGKFSVLKGWDGISSAEAGGFDLYVALDCGDILRLGKYADLFFRQKNTINIDHHPGNDFFAAVNRVVGYASTAELALELIDAMGIELNDEIANLLIAGIVTDTGSFSNANTDSRVFSAAARLMKYRVDINAVNFALRRNTSVNRLRLLGNAFSKVRLFCDGRIALFYTALQDLISYDCGLADTDGFVEHALNIDTALIAVSICEDVAHRFQVSMRSKNNIDVSTVCASFGGGGHRVAAGCVIHGFLEDVIDKIVRAVTNEAIP